MNRVLILFLLLWSVCTACQNELPGEDRTEADPSKVEVSMNVSFNFASDVAAVSRAGTDVAVRRRFVAEVYGEDKTKAVQRKVIVFDEIDTEGKEFRLPLTFYLSAADYTMAVWSDYIAAGTGTDLHYNTQSLASVSCAEPYAGNTDNKDVFYGTADLKLSGRVGEWGAKEQTVLMLSRAATSFKLVTTDWMKFVKLHGKEIAEKAVLTLSYATEHPTGFNVLSGAPTSPKEGISFNCPIIAPKDVSKGVDIATDYIFVSADEEETVTKVNLEVKDENGVLLHQVRDLEVAYKRGGITTLKDNFLTDDTPTDPEGPTEPEEPEEPTNPEELAFTGAGTQTSPFLITSDIDLKKLEELVNAGTLLPDGGTKTYAEACYQQTAEITMPNVDAVPTKLNIGTSTHPFKGTYDGNGKSITNVISTQSDLATYSGGIAMFGVVDGATLTNIRALVVKNMSKIANTASAGICGISRGTTTISNVLCDLDNITCDATSVAALCGAVENGTLTVTACKVASTEKDAPVKSNSVNVQYLGSIIGRVASGATATVTDCYNLTKITQGVDNPSLYIGGICGKGDDGTLSVSRCYSTAAITAVKGVTITTNAGVITGVDTASGITDCYFDNASKVITTGAKRMNKAGNWPAWNTATTAWDDLGAYSEAGSTYPTLNWE